MRLDFQNADQFSKDTAFLNRITTLCLGSMPRYGPLFRNTMVFVDEFHHSMHEVFEVLN